MPHSAKHALALAMARFEKTLAAFEQAHEDYCFRGSKPLEDIPYIEQEYEKHKARMLSSYRNAATKGVSTPKGAKDED